MSREDAAIDRRLPWLLAVLVIALPIAELVRGEARDRAWPLVAWPMYARGRPAPPALVEEIEIRVVAADGTVERVAPAALFTHVHAPVGRRVAAAAFAPGPDRASYRAVLLRRLHRLLPGTDIDEVRARRIGWRTDPRSSPAFDDSTALRIEDLGSFSPREVAQDPRRSALGEVPRESRGGSPDDARTAGRDR